MEGRHFKGCALFPCLSSLKAPKWALWGLLFLLLVDSQTEDANKDKRSSGQLIICFTRFLRVTPIDLKWAWDSSLIDVRSSQRRIELLPHAKESSFTLLNAEQTQWPTWTRCTSYCAGVQHVRGTNRNLMCTCMPTALATGAVLQTLYFGMTFE